MTRSTRSPADYGRDALQLYWAMPDADYYCDLAFDVPPGTYAGNQVGWVLIEIDSHDHCHRPEMCAELDHIALPPSR